MRYVMNTILLASLFAFLLLPGAFIQTAGAAPSPLDMDSGFPGDFMESGVRGRECVETCSIQDENYGDEMDGEDRYEEELEDGGGEYQDQAEEQYDDQYGDEDFQEEVYPEEEY